MLVFEVPFKYCTLVRLLPVVKGFVPGVLHVGIP